MKKDILQMLQQGIIISDGAMGSELMKRGLQPGEVPERWNVDNPDKVQEVHASYIEAGSIFVLTNTFGGNPIKLGMAGLEGRTQELNKAGVDLLKHMGNDRICIAGDIGPTGRFLEPLGKYKEADFVKAFAEQASALNSAGVDALVIETMADIHELKAAVKGVRSVGDVPVAVSMTFEKDAGGNDYHTMMGVGIEQFVTVCEELKVDIIGTNCGKGIHETFELIRMIKEQTDIFTLAFPNAGTPKVENGKTVYDQSPEIMEPFFRNMIDIGVNIIGGCCGTTPEHIKLIRKLLQG